MIFSRFTTENQHYFQTTFTYFPTIIHLLFTYFPTIIHLFSNPINMKKFNQKASNLLLITLILIALILVAILIVLITSKVEQVVHANIIPAGPPSVYTLTIAIVVPLVGEVPLEVFLDGPVAHELLEKRVLVLNLQNMS